MVKLHNGYENDEMAIKALNYCQMYYGLKDFLVCSFILHSCHSYELAVHDSGRNDFSIPDFFQPSCYEEHRQKRDGGGFILVCHMVFSVYSSNDDEL